MLGGEGAEAASPAQFTWDGIKCHLWLQGTVAASLHAATEETKQGTISKTLWPPTCCEYGESLGSWDPPRRSPLGNLQELRSWP